jgi:hypothetical protein
MGNHHQITTPVIQKKSGAAVKLFGLVWDRSGAGRKTISKIKTEELVCCSAIYSNQKQSRGIYKTNIPENPEKETNPNLSSPETKQRQNACIEVTTKHLKRPLAANLHVTEVPTVP